MQATYTRETQHRRANRQRSAHQHHQAHDLLHRQRSARRIRTAVAAVTLALLTLTAALGIIATLAH